MTHKPFMDMLALARSERRRLVAPFVGFPGLNITGCDLPQVTPLENIHAFMRTGRHLGMKQR